MATATEEELRVEFRLKAEIKLLQDKLVAMDKALEEAKRPKLPFEENVAWVPIDGKLVRVRIQSWTVSRERPEQVYLLGRASVEYGTGPAKISLEGFFYDNDSESDSR